MRHFTDFEKSIIKKIVTTPYVEFDNFKQGTIKRCGVTLYYSIINKATAISFTNDNCFISFDLSLSENNILEEYNFTLDFIALIKYLQENNYLYILTEKSLYFKKYRNPDLVESKTEHGFYLGSCYVSQDFHNFCSSKYHPTSALIDLAKDFKTPEMQISEKQIKIGWWAIGIAFFTVNKHHNIDM